MERFHIERGTINEKDYSILEVKNAAESDTGYYTCVLEWYPRLTSRQFVFVHGKL